MATCFVALVVVFGSTSLLVVYFGKLVSGTSFVCDVQPLSESERKKKQFLFPSVNKNNRAGDGYHIKYSIYLFEQDKYYCS